MSEEAVVNSSTGIATNEQSSAVGSFIDQLPEDIRSEACLKDFKDVGSLSKSYVSAQRMLGSSIRIPGEDASQEARQEFYNKLSSVPGIMRAPNEEDPDSINAVLNKLGRPEDPSKYALQAPENLQIDGQELEAWNKEAHALGLTQKQYEGVLAKFIGIQGQEIARFEETKVQGENALRESWGNDYNNRLAAAQAVAKTYADRFPDAMEDLINSHHGNNPALLAMMAELAPVFQERGMIGGQSKIQLGLTADEARAKIQEIEGNMNHAIYNTSDPNHQAAVERRNQLYAAAYPQ